MGELTVIRIFKSICDMNFSFRNISSFQQWKDQLLKIASISHFKSPYISERSQSLPRWRLPLFWTHLPLCLYYPPQGRAFLLIVAITRSLYAYIGYEKGRLWSRMSWWTSWQWLKLEQMFDMQLKEKKESIFSVKTLLRHCMILLIYISRHLLN